MLEFLPRFAGKLKECCRYYADLSCSGMQPLLNLVNLMNRNGKGFPRFLGNEAGLLPAPFSCQSVRKC